MDAPPTEDLGDEIFLESGASCPGCSGEIQRMVVGGRGTYFLSDLSGGVREGSSPSPIERPLRNCVKDLFCHSGHHPSRTLILRRASTSGPTPPTRNIDRPNRGRWDGRELPIPIPIPF